MKKVLTVSFLLLMLCKFAVAQSFYSANIYERTFTATSTERTILYPLASRNISINNFDTTHPICINLYGYSISNGDTNCTDPNGIILASNQSIQLNNFAASGLTIKAVPGWGSASPVTVVVTY